MAISTAKGSLMRTHSSFALRLGGAASAHTSIGIGVNVGFPGYGYGPGYGYAPVGVVSAAYYGGYGGYHYGRYGGWYRPWGAQWAVVAPPIGYGYYAPPVYAGPPLVEAPPASVMPTQPDPVIYPRNGQDAARTEADRQECNRWATTQPAAVAD